MIKLKKDDLINWLILGFIFYLYARWQHPRFTEVFILNEVAMLYSFPILMWINRRTFLSVINPMIITRFKSKLSILLAGWLKVFGFTVCLIIPLVMTASVSFLAGFKMLMFLLSYYTLLFFTCTLCECYLGYTKGISLFVSVYIMIYTFLYYMTGLLVTAENISLASITLFLGISTGLLVLIIRKLKGEVNNEETD